ncbi:MAG: helix-turn-helix domain-containing protein [Treponema sp.]|jgi:transcriptional regulator with XRE-family HTH domain|nr:helix-turn-helix domain-containing protein [Treponema sp.]
MNDTDFGMKTAKKAPGGQEIRRMLARNLKRLRLLRNVSQLELSVMTGLTPNFINDIENCKKWVSSDTLAKLTAALRTQPFQFFLSELTPEAAAEGPLDIYREDFVDMFEKVVSDWMNTYLPEKNKNQESPEDKAAQKR